MKLSNVTGFAFVRERDGHTGLYAVHKLEEGAHLNDWRYTKIGHLHEDNAQFIGPGSFTPAQAQTTPGKLNDRMDSIYLLQPDRLPGTDVRSKNGDDFPTREAALVKLRKVRDSVLPKSVADNISEQDDDTPKASANGDNDGAKEQQ